MKVIFEFYYTQLVRSLHISYYLLSAAERRTKFKNNGILAYADCVWRVFCIVILRMLRRGNNVPNCVPDSVSCFKLVTFSAHPALSHIISSPQHSEDDRIQKNPSYVSVRLFFKFLDIWLYHDRSLVVLVLPTLIW